MGCTHGFIQALTLVVSQPWSVLLSLVSLCCVALLPLRCCPYVVISGFRWLWGSLFLVSVALGEAGADRLAQDFADIHCFVLSAVRAALDDLKLPSNRSQKPRYAWPYVEESATHRYSTRRLTY